MNTPYLLRYLHALIYPFRAYENLYSCILYALYFIFHMLYTWYIIFHMLYTSCAILHMLHFIMLYLLIQHIYSIHTYKHFQYIQQLYQVFSMKEIMIIKKSSIILTYNTAIATTMVPLHFWGSFIHNWWYFSASDKNKQLCCL